MATEQEIPREAIHAYNLYIHGEIDRRAFFDRVKKVAVSTAAAGAIVDQLMPNYALAQQVKPEDTRLKTSRETVQSPNGNGTIKGYLVRPASAGTNKLPAILIVHENRGLNPHIEDVTRRMALEGFMAFAPDGLTSVGGYPPGGDDDQGGKLFASVDRTKMQEDMYAAAVWLKNRPDSTGRPGCDRFLLRRRLWRISWQCGWAPTFRRWRRSMVRRRWKRTWRRSKPRCSCITVRPTRALRRRGRRMRRR
jgi:carboxymethylenebutenolidase